MVQSQVLQHGDVGEQYLLRVSLQYGGGLAVVGQQGTLAPTARHHALVDR